MKIVHLSTADVVGGAARAAYRLHQGLKEAGQQSSMLVRYRHSDDPDVLDCTPRARREAWYQRLRRPGIERVERQIAEQRTPGSEFFSLDRASPGRIVLDRIGTPDVIHLHFVAGLLDLPAVLERLTRIAPVVWTLHDMNAFTGGCHYTEGCERYHGACGCCPQLGSRQERDLSRTIFERKESVYAAVDPKRLRIVAPSRWMQEAAAGSALLGRFGCERIPYGIDTSVFAPIDRNSARATLGLPSEARIVLFVAASIESRRKGFARLVEAVSTLSDAEDLLLVSVGSHCPTVSLPECHRHVAEVKDDRLLAALYSAADLFLIPSLQDNLPNTVLEAMSCGTPVVGFDVGGIADMVRSGETGALVESGDAAGLGRAVQSLLGDPSKCRSMGERSRAVAVTEYSLARQAQDVIGLYEKFAGQS